MSASGAAWLTATAGLTQPVRIQGGLAVNPVMTTVLLAGDETDGITEMF
jgi:hypothetical protein